MAQIFFVLGFIFCVGAIGGLFDPEKILEKVVKDPKKQGATMKSYFLKSMIVFSFLLVLPITSQCREESADIATLYKNAECERRERMRIVCGPKTKTMQYLKCGFQFTKQGMSTIAKYKKVTGKEPPKVTCPKEDL